MAMMGPCLAEDELWELSRAHTLGDHPAAEAHLADCPTCSALLAALLDESDAPARWGALVGRTLGPYRLEAQIGAGGMGAVYRAFDARLGRNVAVKVLPPRAAGTAELERRLATEARAAAAIVHPNVVTIHDVGSADGVTYVVAELVEGESVRSLLARGPLPRARALRLGLELAGGLAAAHAHGVVHRDLKPENLLVTEDGTLKILDFGLAKVDGDGGAVDATEPGTIQGTAGYMAPEQARGEGGDARSDLFAVGAILYELLTGRRAFPGASHAERLSAVLRDTPPLEDPALGALAPVVARCLEKDPRRRFQSAADLAWVLERLPAAAPAPPARLSRRAFLLGAGAAGAAGASGLALGLWRGRRGPAPGLPRFRQLTFRNGRLMSARFTRDGASVLFGAAWDGGPLTAYAVRLDAGTARTLDVPSADVLAVSAREIALSLGRRHTEGQSATGRLALVPIDGGVPRVLLDDVQEVDFTPDGAELALVRRGGAGFRLELPAGRVLLEVPGWITHARISPDGARLACMVHPSVVDDRGDLVLVERATGHMRTLATGWTSIAGLAWDPAGDRIWFSAARTGANCAVHITTLEGRMHTVARTTGRLRVHDVAADRRVAVNVEAWRLRTLVGRLGVAGSEQDRSQSDFSLAMDLSDDGRTLLVGELGDIEAANGAYLRPVAGGPALHVGAGLPLALSPRGQWVAALLAGEPPRVVVYATASAERREVALGALARIIAGRFIDEERLIVAGSVAGRPLRMWRLAPGAAPVALTPPGRGGYPALDAARRRAAFVDRAGRLAVLDLASGALRELPGTYPGHVACGWLDEGDAIAIRTRTVPLRVTRVPAGGGEATPFAEIAPPPVGLRGADALLLHHGGQIYAYSYGQELSQLHLMTIA